MYGTKSVLKFWIICKISKPYLSVKLNTVFVVWTYYSLFVYWLDLYASIAIIALHILKTIKRGFLIYRVTKTMTPLLKREDLLLQTGKMNTGRRGEGWSFHLKEWIPLLKVWKSLVQSFLQDMYKQGIYKDLFKCLQSNFYSTKCKTCSVDCISVFQVGKHLTLDPGHTQKLWKNSIYVQKKLKWVFFYVK